MFGSSEVPGDIFTGTQAPADRAPDPGTGAVGPGEPVAPVVRGYRQPHHGLFLSSLDLLDLEVVGGVLEVVLVFLRNRTDDGLQSNFRRGGGGGVQTTALLSLP